jgi:hypothetical protein
MFGLDTIEALDEFFFKVFLNEKYITESSLQIHQLDENTYKSYVEYQNLIKAPGKETLYLSKNNNFILRYKSFREYNKNFKCIIIIRDPVDHAVSLLSQHKNFCDQQTNDPFVLDYMNWLGHHEFGLNSKVFDFGQPDIWGKYDKLNLNFWLAVWINYHRFLKSFVGDTNLHLVAYTDLLHHPLKLQSAICNEVGVSITTQEKEPFIKNKSPKSIPVDEALLEEANALYSELLKSKMNIE